MQQIIVSNQVVSLIQGCVRMTPLRLCIKHNIPTHNIPIITSGNQKRDNTILRQLSDGTITINQLIGPGVITL